jgi:hypothetical protein
MPPRQIDVCESQRKRKVRTPKTVIAKFYTGKELARLKRIYEKANLKVLS